MDDDMIIAVTVIFGSHRLALTESTGDKTSPCRTVDLHLDDRLIICLSLLRNSPFRFAFNYEPREEFAIWSSDEIYLMRIADGHVVNFENRDAITTAYPLNNYWCLVGDATVTVIDLWVSEILASYEHDEIIISSRMQAGNLLVEDLQHRKLCFGNIAMGGTILNPVLQESHSRPKESISEQ